MKTCIRRTTPLKALLPVALLVVGLTATTQLVTGCGGGKESTSSSAVVATTGRAAFTILWPPVDATTRLLPLASKSVLVEVLYQGEVIGRKLAFRSGSGNAEKEVVTFDNLPLDTLTVRATAYPNTDGTGTAQATGNMAVTIQAGVTSEFTLTMASTIDRLEVTPASVSLTTGQTQSLLVTARDVSGAVVLLAPNGQRWQSSDASASVDTHGVVTAAAAGNALVTVTDVESGKSGSVPVTVNAPPAPIVVKITPVTGAVSVRKSFSFSATVTGTTDTAVNWMVEETGGGVITPAGVYTAPNIRGTYHVIATSVQDPTKSDRVTIEAQAGNLGGTIR